MCENGFGHIFETHISPQKAHEITEQKGTPAYWTQVIKAMERNTKPAVMREVLDEMRQGGVDAVPAKLKKVIEAAIVLAERHV